MFFTIGEVAAELRCSARKISDVARANNIGANLKGSAGWRFSQADVAALLDAMRPAPPPPVRRRKGQRR